MTRAKRKAQIKEMGLTSLTIAQREEVIKSLKDGERHASRLLIEYGGLPDKAVTSSMMGAIRAVAEKNLAEFCLCESGFLRYKSLSTTPEERAEWVRAAVLVLGYELPTHRIQVD